MIPQEELSRTLVEVCYDIETRIREAQRLLLDPRPETLDRCESELKNVIQILEALVSKPCQEGNPAASIALHQIRNAARRLRLQIEHASNLHLGWMQLRSGSGYTNQGLPVFATVEEQSSFEA